MKKLPVGQPDFRQIIEGGYLYVDKTEWIFRLVTGSQFYFFPRPRRFGKSLLVSTLKELFEGNKELFKGLWIYGQYDFKPHPVIVISFARTDFRENSLATALLNQLDRIAAALGLTLSGQTPKDKFQELIEKAGKETPVAVLIDEYDKPITDFMDNLPQANENREVLRNFFGILKDLSVAPYLRFLFITGISKFSKVSLFSELNQLKDLTLHPAFAGMVGITQPELEHHFADRIELLQAEFKVSKDALLAKIKFWYNGYSWDGKTWLYNPFSLLNFFDSKVFRGFWFASGTPSMLVKILKNRWELLEEMEEKNVNEAFFEKYEFDKIDLYSLMFQTGYLTIREVEEFPDDTWFTLGYPNNEVRNAFNQSLLEAFVNLPPSSTQHYLFKVQKALFDGNPAAFAPGLKPIFADISYESLPKNHGNPAKLAAQLEGYYQTVTEIIVKFLGINVQS
ncbi:MAG: AAA family ATPase, partial [Bacteroidota bacterium]